jgi:glycosyltransferase involved in cell wall biosynthesis
MRILHVSPYAPDAWAYGGIPRLVGSLTRELARRGHQVTLCATDVCDRSTRLPKRAAAPARRLDTRLFPNLSNGLAYHLQLFLPLGLHRFLATHAGDFDVAHLHACRNVPGALAAHHLSRAGVPYLLAPNGTAPRIERRLAAKRVFDAVAGRRTLAGAARVLAVSRAEERQFSGLGIDGARVRLVPNPIDLEEFVERPRQGLFRRRLGIPPDAPVVLFLGKLTPRKRVDLLVQAFARLGRADARLVVAGNDMGAERDTRAAVRAAGLEPRTVFTGLLRGRERLEAVADADVFAYPSEHEIFGLAPLEALLAGTPVVVSGDSGCGEVVSSLVSNGRGARVVPCGDAAALAAALESVLAEGQQERAAAAAAGERVRACFSASAVCDRLEDVYVEMAGRP